MRAKIYIAGCGGMLGEAFYRQFKDDHLLKCTDMDVNAPWLSMLDFRNAEAYERDVKAFRPDWLFHLGALTDLEYCEQNPEDAYATNTIAVESAVAIANELSIPLLYISTAGIFDGTHELYDDWDTPNPLGVYARSKFLGERYVCENAERYIICRAGWMMGAGPGKDKKFIQKLMLQLKGGARELFIVDDKDGTPTYTRDFAENVRVLMERRYWGLYNMVCGGSTSRIEVARELVRLLDLEDEVAITAVSSDYFKDTYFAARPPSERLWNRKLALRGVDTMRPWQVALQEYLSEYYGGYLSR
jgi:dTDP-4-dehydrorhamnose reductase